MSALSAFQQSAVLGLCRERVPLGVQARGLKLDRRDVKAAALDLLKQGEIGELPADDIRAGRAFSWPEAMLPDAPDFEDEAPLTLHVKTIEVVIPPAGTEAQLEAQPSWLPALPARCWNGRRMSDRHIAIVDALATVDAGARVAISALSQRLEALRYRGDRKAVQVAVSDLRRLGFVIDFDDDSDGYVLSAKSRAKWIGGDHA